LLFSSYAILETLDASTFVAEYFVQPIGDFEPPVNELDIEMVSMREGDVSLTELSVTDILMEIRLVVCLCCHVFAIIIIHSSNEVAELESGATSPEMQSRPTTAWDSSVGDWQMTTDDQSSDSDDVSLTSFAKTTHRATKRLNKNQVSRIRKEVHANE
jgi:DNA-binding transcriptional regulator YiaG